MPMKRSTAHLPDNKRQELKRIAETIVEEVPSVQMIILFGSHARGDWVQDVYEQNGRIYEYSSDYDILVITDFRAFAARECASLIRCSFHPELKSKSFFARVPGFKS